MRNLRNRKETVDTVGQPGTADKSYCFQLTIIIVRPTQKATNYRKPRLQNKDLVSPGYPCTRSPMASGLCPYNTCVLCPTLPVWDPQLQNLDIRAFFYQNKEKESFQYWVYIIYINEFCIKINRIDFLLIYLQFYI